MCKMAATIMMAHLPNPATEKNIMALCDKIKDAIDAYMEHTDTLIKVLSSCVDENRASINGQLAFSTKKEYNRFLKEFHVSKEEIISCFPYEVIENEKTN